MNYTASSVEVYIRSCLFPMAGQIPQFGCCDEVDMTSLVELRSLVKEQLLDRGIRFSYMPVIIKAVSMALHHYPILNSHTNPECTVITYKADHNIGVAMNTPNGLLVPNIKQCQVCSDGQYQSPAIKSCCLPLAVEVSVWDSHRIESYPQAGTQEPTHPRWHGRWDIFSFQHRSCEWHSVYTTSLVISIQ